MLNTKIKITWNFKDQNCSIIKTKLSREWEQRQNSIGTKLNSSTILVLPFLKHVSRVIPNSHRTKGSFFFLGNS